ncbi:MAG: MGMT family protein [Flavobacteriales bacterium]|nr:MGMT family protein [Flavobacteriales bacterium]
MKMTIVYGYTTSAFGEVLMAYTPIGWCFLGFVSKENKSETENYLRKTWAGNDFLRDDEKIKERSIDIFRPYKKENYPHIHVEGTIFQQKVWHTLMEIPFGTTVSYAQIARKIGQPKAVRALGTAIGKNDISYIIPCHRVIHSDGKISGYRWGTDVKEKILQWEKNLKDIEDERHV